MLCLLSPLRFLMPEEWNNMTNVFEFIEGKMDESEFYEKVLVNAGKALLIIIGIILIGWAISAFVAPSISGGSLTLAGISFAITMIAFVYMFKPKTMKDIVKHVIFAVVYSTSMYFAGQSIVIAIIVLGLIIATTAVCGEVTFTAIFTYRDLKKWVVEKQLEQRSEDAAKAMSGDFTP